MQEREQDALATVAYGWMWLMVPGGCRLLWMWAKLVLRQLSAVGVAWLVVRCALWTSVLVFVAPSLGGAVRVRVAQALSGVAPGSSRENA